MAVQLPEPDTVSLILVYLKGQLMFEFVYLCLILVLFLLLPLQYTFQSSYLVVQHCLLGSFLLQHSVQLLMFRLAALHLFWL